MHLQHNFLASRRFDFVGHIGSGRALPAGLGRDSDQNSDLQQSRIHAQKCNTEQEIRRNSRNLGPET